MATFLQNSTASRLGIQPHVPQHRMKNYFNSIKGSTESFDFSQPYQEGSGIDPDQWASNPYAQFDYRHSGIQKFLESLGFRTKYDEFRESMALNSAEYYSQLAEKAHNEEYDLPINQNARLREAGINPDFAGETSSGSASPMEPDPNAPISPGTDEGAFAPFAQFGSMVVDAFSSAIGLAESGIDMVGKVVNIGSSLIDKDNKILDTAFKAMLAVTSPEDMDNFLNSDMSVQAVNYLPSLTEVFGARRAKKYVSAVNKVATGLTGHDLEAAMRNNFAGNWIGYYNQTAGGSKAGFSMFSDTMKVLRQGLSEDLWNNLKSATKLEGSKIQDAQQYENTRLEEGIPGVEAHNEGVLSSYEVTDKGADISLKQNKLAMRKTLDDMISKLNDEADKGNWFAGLTAIFLQFIGARYLGM